MVENGLTKKDFQEIFAGFEKRQDERLEALDGRVDIRLKNIEERVVNQFHIISEGLIDQIKLLAEGHSGIMNRFDRMEKENEHQHSETRALVKLSFTEMDRRLSNLESQMKEMQEWKKQIETRFQI